MALEQAARDVHELLRRLAGPEDDLRMAATQLTLGVEPRVPEIRLGPVLQALEAVRDAQIARLDRLESALRFLLDYS